MSSTATWHPAWWKQDVHGSAWDRVQAAMERDWVQTRHELGVGGHEINQTIVDTVKQATGSEPIPPTEQANPPKVIGAWYQAEIPLGYGHAAQKEYGTQFPNWTPELEARLRAEWVADVHAPIDWPEAMPLVRRGYAYDENATKGTVKPL